ncbi:MAG: alpha-glucosidase [Bacteroidota bacterium]
MSIFHTSTPSVLKTWWKESVIYQIYPRSFNDSDGDGVGDLRGIIQKLDYLKDLGVDIVWLSPIYKSPNDDNGYDISDYYDIMPEFGTMADFDELLEGLHSRGMRLLMDLVVNHTSDEHEWFKASKSATDNPYRDYYVWKKPVNGGPPNNWRSFFSGSAWELDETTGEYYLHLFAKKQPDLNWENPKVREEVYKLMRFWLDKGIDGFRMDVIPFISKDLTYPDADFERHGHGEIYANGPRVHEFLREMHEEVLRHYDIVTVGEGVGISAEQANDYVGSDRKELHMIFHFDHMGLGYGPGGRMDPADWRIEDFTTVFSKWDRALGDRGWNNLYLGNHDFPRMVSRFGNDEKYWQASAKLLATLLLTQRGTPTIYQGDEIGMTNSPFKQIADFRDIETLNAYKEVIEAEGDVAQFIERAAEAGRDNARTPIQWNAEPHGGFTEGTPWIDVTPNFGQINVANQENDPDSILNFYRKALNYRKEQETLVYGDTEYLNHSQPELYDFIRVGGTGKFRVMLNLSSSELQMPDIEEDWEWVAPLSNYAQVPLRSPMRPWEVRVLRKAIL